MALTVTTDLTVITNGNDGTWNDVGGGAGSAAETDYFVQGTGSRSRAVSGASASRGMVVDIGGGNELDFTVAGANEDELLYFWIQCYTPGLVDNLATAPGLRIRLDSGATDGTDWAEWDIAYSDLLAVTNLPANEFFRVYVLDPRAPTTRTNGSWTLATVRHFGAVLDTNATAKGQNLGIDRICHGRGELIVSGTPTDLNGGFAELISAAWDTIDDSVAIGSLATSRHGIINVRSRTAFMKGKLIIGDDAGVVVTDFTGVDQSFEWEDTFYYDGTRVRSTVGYDSTGNFTGRDSNGLEYYGISIVGNGTGDTDVDFGVLVGTDLGRSGPAFAGSPLTPTVFEGDDAAVESLQIFGTIFSDFRRFNMAANAATDDFFGNVLADCGTFIPGPVMVRNTNFITGLGAAYTFLENFINIEASGAEQLSTADPSTEWTDLLNGADWNVQAAETQYLELLGGTTRTNITHLDDDKVGSDDHYTDMLVRFPAAGATQGTLGPVIAVDAAAQDYFYFEVDLVNDHVEVFRVDVGVDTSIAGSGAAGDFTMDEDENYMVLLRRSGTTIEAYISGNSAADGQHTLKLSATDANHTGTSHRRTGVRGDALAGQTGATGERPRVSRWGTGPITDDFGSLLFPAQANDDSSNCRFIECTRALSYNTASALYAHDAMNVTSPVAAGHNDSNGAVTASFTNTDDVPLTGNVENTGSGTTTFQATVTLTVQVDDSDGDPVNNATVRIELISDGSLVAEGFTNASGTFTDSSFNFVSDTDVLTKVRLKGFKPFRTGGTIVSTGLTVGVTFQTDSIVDLP